MPILRRSHGSGRREGVSVAALTRSAAATATSIKHGHLISSLKGDHQLQVVRILIPTNANLRAKVLQKPASYRVHTSHFAEEDKMQVRGRLTIKPGALPRGMNEAMTWRAPTKPSSSASAPAAPRPPVHPQEVSDARPLAMAATPPTGLRPLSTRPALRDLTNTPIAQRAFTAPSVITASSVRSPRGTQAGSVTSKKRRLGMPSSRPAPRQVPSSPAYCPPVNSRRPGSLPVPHAGQHDQRDTSHTAPSTPQTPRHNAGSQLVSPRDALDPEAVKHMRQTIATLERQLKDAKVMLQNKDLDCGRAEEKLERASPQGEGSTGRATGILTNNHG